MTQRGQSLVEYLVVTAAIVVALLVPWTDGTSGAQRLADAIARLYRNYSFLVSIG